ncbi:hypothetical protein [Aeromonas molluscorum]|uniref:hypothetical protein n=1 Tax=Aeromonas molluscorum TaxID=271417 RepID=UPI003F1B2F95
MKLKFIPIRKDDHLRAFVNGDVLILNGVSLDFSPLTDGGTLPAFAVNSEWIASGITRINGEVHLSIFIPHGANAPQETRYPLHFEQYCQVLDGEVPIPEYEVES